MTLARAEYGTGVPIAVLGALDFEIRALREEMTITNETSLGAWTVHLGQIAGRDVALARSGLGKVNVAVLAGLLWERFRPGTVLFTGVAGGLDPGLGVGDVVIGQRTIQHDWGTITPDGLTRYQAGHFPFYKPTDELGFAPSDQLLGLAIEASEAVELTPVLDRHPRFAVGTIITGDQFLRDETTRDRLFAEMGARAIEMEGAALGQAASRLGFDHLVVRSLSDLAGTESIDDFARFLPEVAANSAHLVLEIIRRL